MKNNIIAYLIALFLLSFLFLCIAIYYPLQSRSFAEEKIFEIREQEGLFKIAQKLERKKLIRDNLIFELYVIARADFYNLKRGHYRLSTNMSIAEIAQKIIDGETVDFKLTFIEGWDRKKIGEYLEEKEVIQLENFLEQTKNYNKDLELLKNKPKELNLEGYLFPDTYFFEKNVNSKEIIDRMLLTLQNKLKKETELENKNIHKIITMASLIEKEVKTYEDKRIVSGIAWKRLENNVPLQMDATITYLTGKNSTKVSLKETEIDSPYNTYKNRGLPPGPICNPGLDSIKAALNPKESEYWYYLSTPSGETIFSRNLREHNIAKEKYLKN